MPDSNATHYAVLGVELTDENPLFMLIGPRADAHENDAPIDQIGDMLGHADLRTTRDLYIKPADRLRKAASDHINL